MCACVYVMSACVYAFEPAGEYVCGHAGMKVFRYVGLLVCNAMVCVVIKCIFGCMHACVHGCVHVCMYATCV